MVPDSDPAASSEETHSTKTPGQVFQVALRFFSEISG